MVATALGRLQRLSRVPVSHPLRVPVMDALEAHVLASGRMRFVSACELYE